MWSDFLTTHPRVEEFERVLTETVDAVVAVRKYSSDLGPGDTALVPTVTFVATANVACMAGAKIVFADVMPPQD
jgi:dTDP-4-amino-4,6-dideoxygalactose transaminase